MAAVSPPFSCAPHSARTVFWTFPIQGNNARYWYVCIILRNEEDYRFIHGGDRHCLRPNIQLRHDAANETLVIKGKGNSVADLNITSSVGSLEIGAATGDISATDVSNGLNVGDVGNVNVSGTNVNVHDGKTVSGNIVSTTDFTLTNGGSARAEATTSPNSGASMPTTPRRFRAKSTTT